MLRSTEFFRSIECPFYGGGGSSDGDSCNRPYCHFRHRSQKPREKPEGDGQCLTADREHGYDPYNPELPKGSSRNGDGISSEFTESSSSTLELELVNKAIEVVKNEVEQEQKRLLRYEDLLDTEEEYVPSVPSTQKALGKNKSCTEHLPIEDELKNSLEYNPDSYGLNSNVEYTPTPLSVTACFSKYTLDTDDEADAKGNSLKYVPTLMNKPVKYSTSVPSNKYVIDNTKPCTDLEYDPLLNYSARLMSKKRTIKPGTKRPRENSSEAPYTPAGKKRCHRLNSKICEEMEFPDSQGKINDNCPQSQGDTSKFRNAVLCDNKYNEGFPSKAKDLNKRSMKEIAVQYDVDDCRFERKRQENREKQKLKSSRHSSKISRSNKDKLKGKEPKDKKNKGGDLNSSKFKAHNDKVGSTKIKPSHHTQKANKKEKINCEKEIKREKQRETLRHKERNGDDPVDEIKQKGDDKSKTKEEKQKFKNGNSDRKLDKLKMSKSDEVRGENRSKSRSNSLSDSAGKVKCREVKITSIQKSDKNNGTSRSKALVHKNGIHVGSKRKEEIKESKSMKDKTKHPEKTKEKACLTKRTLSHTDLFGDDSSDDESTSKPVAAICCELDSDSDQDVYASTSSSDNEKGQSCVQHSIPSEDEIDFPGLEKEFEFESDPMEECLRIFNESKEVKNEDKGRVSKQVSVESTEDKESSLTTLFPGQKRRISHISKQENVEPAKPIIRPFRRLTAQEVCYQRSLMAQQQAAQLVEAEKIVNTPFRNRGEKRRIAHKPKADVIPSAKQSPVKLKMESLNRTVVSQNCPRNSSLNLRCQTTAGMASKTASTTSQKRIAHTPTLKSSLKRPTIPTEYGSKVPTNVRQRYLNVFIDECLKFCGSEETAFEKALNEEKIVYNRSTSRTVYLNVAVNTLKKLRSQSDAVPSPTKNTVTVRTNKKVQSHEALLGGKLATKTSFTLNRSGKQQDIELTGAMLYKKLSEYVLTEEQLQENCYPRPHPEKPGVAVLYNQDERKNNTDSLIRICCRCGGEYSVSVSGDCIRKEECNYHWGRLRRQKIPGGWETQYSCCAGAVGSAGCQTAKQHVQDGRKEKLGGFMKTFDKEMPLDENPGVFALDCEMCYTKQGLELTRLTVINPDLKVVYDTFVKPDNKVIDYNTRFSGVTEEDMESTTITIRDVQAVLLNMFSAATILIGHSLESDLFALKLIHSTVIDTAVVFPHRLGLPYKRALKNLMADYLKRIIQDNVEGHDSSEDACACMELMLWRLKEDAKLRR